MNKRGILLHPGTWIVAAFIIGAVVMFVLTKSDVMGLGGMVCGK